MPPTEEEREASTLDVASQQIFAMLEAFPRFKDMTVFIKHHKQLVFGVRDVLLPRWVCGLFGKAKAAAASAASDAAEAAKVAAQKKFDEMKDGKK